LSIRIGKKLRRRADALIERSSFVSNAPVLDVRDFAWTHILRENWRVILDEARGAGASGGRAAARRGFTRPQKDRAAGQMAQLLPAWLWLRHSGQYGTLPPHDGAGAPGAGPQQRLFLDPRAGSAYPAASGVTKGLVTCHLGLIVPNGNLRMRVDREIVRWAEGETLLFDDTYEHEVWNDTDETRVVLLIQAARPVRSPGKWLANLFLWGVKHTVFVREARDNVALWARNMRRFEDAHGLDKV
jgi:hypothetical protein